jgi:hypothetical protein
VAEYVTAAPRNLTRPAGVAAKARDDGQVVPIYRALRTAEDHITESCGVLEDKAKS